MRTLMLLSLLFSLLLTQGVWGFDPASYPNSTQLNPDYQIFWKINEKKEEIQLALQVKTLGWIGFGIGEPTTGSMPGADMVIISFENSKPTISDRYATAFATPLVDTCEDWVLVSSTQSEGETVVEVKRKLNTTDSQDRPIVPGGSKIVYAYGSPSDLALTYHQERRGIIEVALIPSSTPNTREPESGEKSAIFTMENYLVPAQKTTYACRAVEIPLPPDSSDHHIIQIDPVIDPRGMHLTHHMLIHICQNTSETSYVNRYFNHTDTCFTPIGDPQGGCMSLLYSWALGVGPLIIPKDAGFRMGYNRPAFRFMVIEIHYNNPSFHSGVLDSSGFKIYYTPTLRQYDAGTLTLGDPFLSFDAIPPNVQKNKYEASCPSNCTQKFSHEIKVFGSFQHMHAIGSMMWGTHYRDEKLLGNINRAEYYSYENQQSTLVNITIKPGDRINTHCIFDSTSRQNTTYFGLESTDEMCMDFLSYYPRLDFQGEDFSMCGYIAVQNADVTVCGSISGVATGDSLLFVPNPVVSDMAAGEARVFGVEGDQCKRLDPLYIGIGLGVGAMLILLVVIGGIIYSKRIAGYQPIHEKVGMQSGS